MKSQLRHTLWLGLSALILGLMVAGPVWAAELQRDKANWDNLKELVSGQDVQIVLNDAKSFHGKFQSVSDEALVTRLATGEQSFNRQSVLRVSSKGQEHRGRNAGLGAAIGFGAGAAIGAATGSSQEIGGRGAPALVGAVIGLGIGVGVGVALPSGGWRDVYRAR